MRQPQVSLDWKLKPSHFKKFSHEDPPKLHFGITASWPNIVNCAERNSLTDLHGSPLQYYEFRTRQNASQLLYAVVDYLELRCEFPIFHETVFGEGDDCIGMFALYDNYNVDYKQILFSEEEEENVLEIIKQELGVQNQEPKWWWNAEYLFRCVCMVFESVASASADVICSYICPLSEYNLEDCVPPNRVRWPVSFSRHGPVLPSSHCTSSTSTPTR